MKQLYSTAGLLLVFLLLISTSCQVQEKRLAYRDQRLLDEADILMQKRDFHDAYEKAKEAKDELNLLVKDSPKNVDFSLLYIRSCLSLFLSENTLILEGFPNDPKSLVPIIDINKYLNYKDTIQVALDLLKEIKDHKMTTQQKSSYYTLYGSILCLNPEYLSLSSEEYYKAIASTKQWLEELKTAQKQSILSVVRVKNQLIALQLA